MAQHERARRTKTSLKYTFKMMFHNCVIIATAMSLNYSQPNAQRLRREYDCIVMKLLWIYDAPGMGQPNDHDVAEL